MGDAALLREFDGSLTQLVCVLRCVGNLISYLKLLAILLIVSGQNPFLLLGLDTPRAWTWSQDNKVGLSEQCGIAGHKRTRTTECLGVYHAKTKALNVPDL